MERESSENGPFLFVMREKEKFRREPAARAWNGGWRSADGCGWAWYPGGCDRNDCGHNQYLIK